MKKLTKKQNALLTQVMRVEDYNEFDRTIIKRFLIDYSDLWSNGSISQDGTEIFLTPCKGKASYLYLLGCALRADEIGYIKPNTLVVGTQKYQAGNLLRLWWD